MLVPPLRWVDPCSAFGQFGIVVPTLLLLLLLLYQRRFLHVVVSVYSADI